MNTTYLISESVIPVHIYHTDTVVSPIKLLLGEYCFNSWGPFALLSRNICLPKAGMRQPPSAAGTRVHGPSGERFNYTTAIWKRISVCAPVSHPCLLELSHGYIGCIGDME